MNTALATTAAELIARHTVGRGAYDLPADIVETTKRLIFAALATAIDGIVHLLRPNRWS